MWERTWVATPVAMCLALVASVACAGSANQLKATLSRMDAVRPIEATVSVHSKVFKGDLDKPEVAQVRSRLSLNAGAGQFHVKYSKKLLEHLRAESREKIKNPDAPQPAQILMKSVSPLQAHELVDFAPTLLRWLDGATLQSQRKDTYSGKPVRLLMFKMPLKTTITMSDPLTDKVNHQEGHLRVWLGADGVPVAVVKTQDYKGNHDDGKSSYPFSVSVSKRATIRHVGQRLIVVRLRKKLSASSRGHVDNSRTVWVKLDVIPEDTRTATPVSISK